MVASAMPTPLSLSIVSWLQSLIFYTVSAADFLVEEADCLQSMNTRVIFILTQGYFRKSAIRAVPECGWKNHCLIPLLMLEEGGGLLCLHVALVCSLQGAEAYVDKAQGWHIMFRVAASQGALLLAGGEKGMRYAMPNARIMIHQPQSGCGGHVEDVRRQVNEAVHSRHKIDKMYAAFTGQPLEKVQQYTERDRFLSVSEAMEFGLMDGVLETEY
ncbi:UNVERIFIED_CONTAM: ATP-dependent Clp protease proteolytic subunit, chloroplastic [Sesamum calycinum]|uniref:ATP-dependent Clp protease proteolytic subunit n=1 Tax=Sesamum calycinum TaxID=2727403 RepID=A0AAW2PLI6_9LAMI